VGSRARSGGGEGGKKKGKKKKACAFSFRPALLHSACQLINGGRKRKGEGKGGLINFL